MTAACSLALALTLAAPAAPVGAFPYPVQRRVLDNGLQVLLVRHPTPGVAAYFTVLRVGSRNEVEPGRTGFAHFFEHLSYRGSKNVSADQWQRAIKLLGAEENAFTDDDITAYWVTGPSAALPRIIELESDRLLNLAYADEDFQVESRAVLGELLKDMVSPDFTVEEVGRGLAFSRHTYKHTTIGLEKDVRAMPSGYHYSLDLYQRFYRPDNAIVIVVGDFDPAKVLADIEARYGAWSGKGEVARTETEPPQREEKQRRVEWPTPILPRVWSAWHTPAGWDIDATATQLVLWPLLFGRPSPVYRQLVLEQHLVEEIGGDFQPHRDPYLFGYELVLKGAEAERSARAAVDRAVADVAAGRVDDRLLADVKSNVLAALVMQSDTPYRTGVWLAYYTGITGDPGYLDAVMARVARVSRADLAAFARAWLKPTNRTTVVVASAPPSAASAATGARR